MSDLRDLTARINAHRKLLAYEPAGGAGGGGY